MKFLVFLIALSVVGMTGAQSQIDPNSPVNITADQLELRQAQGRAVFQSNVKVIHAEMILTSDFLEVYYGGENTEIEGDIDYVTASGNVHITLSEDEKISADRATYNPQQQQLTLDDNVTLIRAGSQLQGDRLTYDLSEGIARLMSTPGQGVRAEINPNQSADAAE